MTTPTDPVADLLAGVASFTTAYDAAVVERAKALLVQAMTTRDAYAERIPTRRSRKMSDDDVAKMRTRLIALDRLIARLESVANASDELVDLVWWAK